MEKHPIDELVDELLPARWEEFPHYVALPDPAKVGYQLGFVDALRVTCELLRRTAVVRRVP